MYLDLPDPVHIPGMAYKTGHLSSMFTSYPANTTRPVYVVWYEVWELKVYHMVYLETIGGIQKDKFVRIILDYKLKTMVMFMGFYFTVCVTVIQYCLSSKT